METLRNLRERICDYTNLMEAYRSAAKSKRYRNEVLEFSFQLGENLHELQEELLNMTYRVGPYREFYVRYPKPRLVMALGFRDRVVQWAIYRQINPFLDKRYIAHSYGCREGKGTLAAAECLYNWIQKISRKPDAAEWYIIKGDISKYFYRVDHEMALETYGSVCVEVWFLWLMDAIINNPDVPFGLPLGMKPDDCPRSKRLCDVGMPIGNLTSQETANLYLNRLDQYVKHTLRAHYYERYMDDFGILVKGKDTAREVFGKIEQFLRSELLLEMSPKSKIQKAIAPIEFVGYLITPHGIRIRKKTTAHIKRSLRHIMAEFAAGRMSYEAAMEGAVCYLGQCRCVSGYNLARWIEEHFVLQRDDANMDGSERLPTDGRHFYSILENEDGTADVYLRPDVMPMTTENGATDYDVRALVVKGVELTGDLEADIRERYDDWCASGEKIYL